jgi:hypothetical protein
LAERQVNGRRSSDAGQAREALWLNPRIIVGVLALPLLLIAYLVPAESYRLLFRTSKHIGIEFLLIGALGYLAFLIGTLAPDRRGPTQRPQVEEMRQLAAGAVVPLFAVTCAGYAIWTFVGMANAGGPLPLLELVMKTVTLQGGASTLKREIFTSVPGVTTLTQVGVLYVTVEALLWKFNGAMSAPARIRMSVIGGLVLLRVLVISERLALIELVIPVAVVMLGAPSGAGARGWTGPRAMLVAGLGVFSLFAVGEYFRSWATFYRDFYSGPYLQFAAERLLGYYTTALNNGAIYVSFQETQVARATAANLLEFPVVGGELAAAYDRALTVPGTLNHGQLLDTYGTQEFNNVALIGQLHNDFTVAGMALMAALLGLITMSLYRSFVHQQIAGMLLYPSWFIGVLEISRIYFWANQRYFPVLLFALLVLLFYRRRPELTMRLRPVAHAGRASSPGSS